MWLSTKKTSTTKKKTKNELFKQQNNSINNNNDDDDNNNSKAAAAATELSSKFTGPTGNTADTTTTITNNAWQSSLPLDWTRMSGQKRKLQDGSNDDDDDNDEDIICCQNLTTTCLCRRKHNNINISRPQFENSISIKQVHGQAIFCLHDSSDPQWIQGYFVPISTSSKRPWGLLAIQEEIDDCLVCNDGGYRRITLNIYMKAQSRQQRSKPYKIENVNWTGGDMITLNHPNGTQMETQRLVLGQKAIPILNKYFHQLLIQLQQECNINNDVSILEWLPDIAVVIGTMTLTLPNNNNNDE